MSKRSALDARVAEIVARAAREITALVQDEFDSLAPTEPPPERMLARKGPPGSNAVGAEITTPSSRKPHPSRSYTDAEVEAVLALIASKPGIRTERIKAEIGGDDATIHKILGRLRTTGRVATTGIKRAMTYSAAGGSGAMPASPIASDRPVPTPRAPSPLSATATQSTSADIVDRVRADLAAAYEGLPVSPGRLAFRLKADPDLVDAALSLLVKRREAKAMGARGKIGYVPFRAT